MSDIRYLDIGMDEIFESQEQADDFMASYIHMIQQVMKIDESDEDAGAAALFRLFGHFVNNKAVYSRFDELFEKMKSEGKKLEKASDWPKDAE